MWIASSCALPKKPHACSCASRNSKSVPTGIVLCLDFPYVISHHSSSLREAEFEMKKERRRAKSDQVQHIVLHSYQTKPE